MLADLCQSNEDGVLVVGDVPLEAHRAIDFAMTYRSKDDFEPLMTLPRWTAWLLVAWTIGATATYTAILARWWE